MSETAKRPTGSIPLSWARPAEDVSAAPSSSTKLPMATVVALVVVAILIGGIVINRATDRLAASGVVPSPPSPQPSAPAVPPAPAAPPEPPSIASAPEPAVVNPGVAPEDDDTVSGTKPAPPAADRKRAQSLLRAARIAARDEDNAKAIALSEDAVDKDPGCFECWSTLAFLRQKTGDKDGARTARLRARSLATTP